MCVCVWEREGMREKSIDHNVKKGRHNYGFKMINRNNKHSKQAF